MNWNKCSINQSAAIWDICFSCISTRINICRYGKKGSIWTSLIFETPTFPINWNFDVTVVQVKKQTNKQIYQLRCISFSSAYLFLQVAIDFSATTHVCQVYKCFQDSNFLSWYKWWMYWARIPVFATYQNQQHDQSQNSLPRRPCRKSLTKPSGDLSLQVL